MANEWAAEKRRYAKAIGILDDYSVERDIVAALAILRGAAKQINAEHTSTRKALGVGRYRPYGR